MHKHWFYERDGEVVGLSEFIGGDHAALLAWGWFATGVTAALLELGLVGWVGLQLLAHVLLAAYLAKWPRGTGE